MAYDLIVKTPPHSSTGRDALGKVHGDVMAIDDIARFCEVTAGSAEPNIVDTIVLGEIKDDGEFNFEEFAQVCRAKGVQPDDGNASAAAAYIDWLWGASLTTISLPRDDNDMRRAFSTLVEFVRNNGYVLDDPQAGMNVDLASSGETPPMW